jgi:hypothetical protein
MCSPNLPPDFLFSLYALKPSFNEQRFLGFVICDLEFLPVQDIPRSAHRMPKLSGDGKASRLLGKWPKRIAAACPRGGIMLIVKRTFASDSYFC